MKYVCDVNLENVDIVRVARSKTCNNKIDHRRECECEREM